MVRARSVGFMAARKPVYVLRRIAQLTRVPGPATASQSSGMPATARLIIHSFCGFFKKLDRAFLCVALRVTDMLLCTKTIDKAAAQFDQLLR